MSDVLTPEERYGRDQALDLAIEAGVGTHRGDSLAGLVQTIDRLLALVAQQQKVVEADEIAAERYATLEWIATIGKTTTDGSKHEVVCTNTSDQLSYLLQIIPREYIAETTVFTVEGRRVYGLVTLPAATKEK